MVTGLSEARRAPPPAPGRRRGRRRWGAAGPAGSPRAGARRAGRRWRTPGPPRGSAAPPPSRCRPARRGSRRGGRCGRRPAGTPRRRASSRPSSAQKGSCTSTISGRSWRRPARMVSVISAAVARSQRLAVGVRPARNAHAQHVQPPLRVQDAGGPAGGGCAGIRRRRAPDARRAPAPAPGAAGAGSGSSRRRPAGRGPADRLGELAASALGHRAGGIGGLGR